MENIYCKWVSESMTTRNNTCWEIGVPKELPDKDNLELCYAGLFHYFSHPLLAVIFKESCRCGHYSKLYEVLPEGKVIKDWDKCGATKLTLVKELEIPEVALINKIAFGILCSLEIYKAEEYVDWAEKWLSGEDRSKESATAAAIRALKFCSFQDGNDCFIINNSSYYSAYVAYSSVIDLYDISQANDYLRRFFLHPLPLDYVVQLNPLIDLIEIAKKAMAINPTF